MKLQAFIGELEDKLLLHEIVVEETGRWGDPSYQLLFKIWEERDSGGRTTLLFKCEAVMRDELELILDEAWFRVKDTFE